MREGEEEGGGGGGGGGGKVFRNKGVLDGESVVMMGRGRGSSHEEHAPEINLSICFTLFMSVSHSACAHVCL